jgi:glyoxylase-like metal-dependent hydrolase (beta-lactamase superfamily II)
MIDWNQQMAQQIPLSSEARAFDATFDSARDDKTHQIAPDLAYRRLGIVNVVLFGPPGAGDREWVLIDAGLAGTKELIASAAGARFHKGARPSAIVLTHGHFDHVGAVEALAEEWDAPVYAHSLEMPYLDGRASYPPGDPSVGGGAMALLARFYPRGPINLGLRLAALPNDFSVPGMPGWRWVHTPGHSVGHVSLWRDSDRAIIVGDAFVTTAQESAYSAILQSPEMHGPPMYYTVEWDKARDSLRRLTELGPDLVVTGHGEAMRGPEMLGALERLAETFDEVAVPQEGRYLDKPARAEDGTAYQPA